MSTYYTIVQTSPFIKLELPPYEGGGGGEGGADTPMHTMGGSGAGWGGGGD